MVESKEHDVNPSGIKEDDLTEQIRHVELVRYRLIFLLFSFLRY
jgi:hypothetical protein